MKFILAFTICSAVTGFCNNTMTIKPAYDTWTECVVAGSQLTIKFAELKEKEINREKLYISYFCNENNTNKTPT
jgi:hypothetical protein